MVRLHTRKGGKSRRSKRHYPRENPPWVEKKPEEIEAIVEKLVKEGKEPAQIGMILRDQHAVPDIKAATGKRLSKILEEKGAKREFPSDLMDLIKRAVRVRKHLKANRADKSNRIKLEHIEAKIRRTVSYLNRTGRLNNWKYDPEKAALLVR
ncbi:MAG: 30S ribosomal protein S15 [Candidatus Micrarchaeota archaeon]|nr:30S ribosomal protein S15 [Candidatus Micrarchaeota archaeon]